LRKTSPSSFRTTAPPPDAGFGAAARYREPDRGGEAALLHSGAGRTSSRKPMPGT
jgi:hypothetical protein